MKMRTYVFVFVPVYLEHVILVTHEAAVAPNGVQFQDRQSPGSVPFWTWFVDTPRFISMLPK